MIPIGYGFVQKGILSQRGVSSKCLNVFLCPPRVLSSAGVIMSLTDPANNPFKILYRLASGSSFF